MHMNRIRIHIFFLIVILAGGIQAQNPRSVFTDRPGDSAAVYLLRNTSLSNQMEARTYLMLCKKH